MNYRMEAAVPVLGRQTSSMFLLTLRCPSVCQGPLVHIVHMRSFQVEGRRRYLHDHRGNDGLIYWMGIRLLDRQMQQISDQVDNK